MGDKKKLFGKLLVPEYTEDDIEKVHEAIKKGNIPAQMGLIMHNQRIINIKLNKLLDQ